MQLMETLEVCTYTVYIDTYVQMHIVTAAQYFILSGCHQFLDKIKRIHLAHHLSVLFCISIYKKRSSTWTSLVFPQNGFFFGKYIPTKESWPAPVLAPTE